MEIRKVQLTGGSSFVLTLPKEWVRSMGIKKNDALGLMVQPDGTLMVTTRTTEARPHRAKEIKSEVVGDQTHLFRILIGAYIMGFSTITVRSVGRMPAATRDTVLRFAQMTVGPEIMEETVSTVTVRDLLNPTEMPFDKTIRRMHILVRTMHEDALLALETRSKGLAEEVLRRDADINRLNWLVARQYNMVLNDMTLARRMGVGLEEAGHWFLIARILERVGDHGIRIVKGVLQLVDRRLEKELQTAIKAASAESLALLDSSLDSWFKRDIRAANENIDSLAALLAKCERIHQSAQHVKSAYSIPVTDIAESIRRTGEYAADVSELAINTLVTEMK